jgi:hypothetical protein
VSTTVTSEDCGNPTQLGIGYSIPASTTSGSHQLTIGTVYGVGHGTFTVDDPTPAISGISPSTWVAGGEQYFTISGSYFGSGPSIGITGDVGSYGMSSSSDTSISAFVDLTYSSGGSATVTVQSYGYGGNGFMEGSGGGSPNSQSSAAQIQARPAQLLVTNDCWWPDGSSISVGYTRVVSYQVVGPAPANQLFYGPGVPTVQENVVPTGGVPMSGGGVWDRVPDNTITAQGVFTDILSANGHAPSWANQSFTATDAVGSVGLVVNIGGGTYNILANYYSTSTMTIAGTTAPRQCVFGRDPR